MQHGKLCGNRCPWTIIQFFQSDCKYISTMLPQDTSDGSSSSPASTRRRSTSIRVVGNLLRDLPVRLKEFTENLEKTTECLHQGTHPQALLVIQVRNVLKKWRNLQANQDHKGSFRRCEQNTFAHCTNRHRHFVRTSHRHKKEERKRDFYTA